MSRTDQYMGLTNEGNKFLEGLGAVEVERREIDGAWNLVTLSTFRKNINDGVNDYEEFREVVQDSPWSSGPMYFTCLEWWLKKKADPIPLFMCRIYEWHCAPDLKEKGLEYDYDRGAYYV